MRRHVILVAASTLFAGAANAQVIELAKTGQTRCYDAEGEVTACAGTGQDGEIQAGVAWPEPRFIDNDDGSLTDHLTGLTWLRDANCIATHYPEFDEDTYEGDPAGLGDGSVEWAHCLEFVAGINAGSYPDCAAGASDWRVPNVNELETLAYLETTGFEWLESQGFTHLVVEGYWTSSTHRFFLPGNGWFVDLYAGAVSNTDKTDVGGCLPVRGGQVDGSVDEAFPANVPRTGQTTTYEAGDDGELRTGVAWPSPRFTDHDDGTVTDELTGLMWLRDANCLATEYPEVDADGKIDWQSALDFVADLNAGAHPSCAAGRADWRLPNRRELHSLTDHGQTTGDTLPEGHPFTNIAIESGSGYWSSTSYLSIPGWAWFWAPKTGDVSGTPKAGERRVWPVRRTVEVTPEPNLGLTPRTIDFGEVTITQTSLPRTLTLSNTGGELLDVRYMIESSPVTFPLDVDASETACGSTFRDLEPGESCTVQLRFSPNVAGSYDETLTIRSNDPDEPDAVVSLIGEGVDYPEGAPRCEINPTTHDFGDQPINQVSAYAIFTIGNHGDAPLNVTIFNDVQAESFRWDLGRGDFPCGPLPFTVGVEAYCTFGVAFAPTRVGDREGWIHIHSNDPIHPSIQLTLTGFAGPDESEGGCACGEAQSTPDVGRLGAILLWAGLIAAFALRGRWGHAVLRKERRGPRR